MKRMIKITGPQKGSVRIFFKITRWLWVIVILQISSCTDLINITGYLANRVNAENKLSASIFVIVKNSKGKIIPNMQVSIIHPVDSVNITQPKFTENSKVISFNLPEEQISNITPNTEKLLLLVYHPQAGLHQRFLSLSTLEQNRLTIVEFNIMFLTDSLPKAQMHQYLKFPP